MDKIIIEGLELFCNHGVLEEENRLGQKFLVSAILYVDARRAGKTDDLDYSVHYGEAAMKIKEWMEHTTYALIETAGEVVCENLLLEYPLLKKVTLRIEKPWAPVALHLKTVGVEITRGWHEAYLSIGSNMGDKEALLRFAVDELNASDDTEVVTLSDFIVTEPYGYKEQDKFLNGCLKLKTLKTPYELLDFVHEIEAKAGRERTIQWGPRTLDLDIIFYDELITGENDLVIPHKDMENRQFVLEPLMQIAPNFVHPLLRMSVEKLYKNLENK